MDTQVKLEHEVSFRWLIVFALPTILSSIFSSLYSTVDGIFIARLVDTDALSAINITMPMIFLESAIGMMFGSGGNALVAKKLGEGSTGRFFTGNWQAQLLQQESDMHFRPLQEFYGSASIENRFCTL